MTDAPYIEDDDLEQAKTDPSELQPAEPPDPDKRAAEFFAGLVRNMLEEKLGPIHERLNAGDERFGRIEQRMDGLEGAMRTLAGETARANNASVKLRILESDVGSIKARCPLCESLRPNGGAGE